MQKHSRRDFLETTVLAVAGGNAAMAQNAVPAGDIPRKILGSTGLAVSAIGVGGYHLGSAKDEAEAKKIVDMAIDAGVNFFDNAWDYHDGESEQRLGNALKGKRDRVVLMTKGRRTGVAWQFWE
jgi:aryl-alcohol dehydrogenase-like predicted oxidoreductase